MLRLMFRLIVLTVVAAGVAVLYFGYWRGGMPELLEKPAAGFEAGEAARGAADTIAGMVDNERVRQTGSQIAGQMAKGAERAGAALEEARVTAKIKSKMALDDTLDASRINVDTSGTTVTVAGSVATRAQYERALQLARETQGVARVIDKLEVHVP
jgi:hyperosmotically inducible periplasmic protein